MWGLRGTAAEKNAEGAGSSDTNLIPASAIGFEVPTPRESGAGSAAPGDSEWSGFCDDFFGATMPGAFAGAFF